MSHKDKSVEELFEFFTTVSRQAISALRKKNANDLVFCERIDKAKEMLKLQNRGGKPVVTNDSRVKASWSTVLTKVNKGTHTADETFSDMYKFYYWCYSQSNFEHVKNSGEIWELRIDILDKHNTKYSVDTAMFLPRKVAQFFNRGVKDTGSTLPFGVIYNKANNTYIAQHNATERYLGVYYSPEEAFNAYKVSKEVHGKILARKYKGKIDDRVIEMLINYAALP